MGGAACQHPVRRSFGGTDAVAAAATNPNQIRPRPGIAHQAANLERFSGRHSEAAQRREALDWVGGTPELRPADQSGYDHANAQRSATCRHRVAHYAEFLPAADHPHADHHDLPRNRNSAASRHAGRRRQ